MTEAAQIRRAIKRTQRFRDWFKKSVPKKAIDLNTVLDDPTRPNLLASQVAKSRPASTLISCGTIGCVMGWSKVYPGVKHSKTSSPYEYLGVDFTGDDSIFDGCQPTEEKNQKAAAILRLNRHVKNLRQVLKDVA